MSGVIREFNVDNRCSPRVSAYDHFNAGLIAAIVVCGFVVVSLLVVWLFGAQQESREVPLDFDDPVVIEDPAGLEEDLDEVVGGSNSAELVSLLESVEESVSNQKADKGSPRIGGSLPGRPDVRLPDPIPSDSHSSRWKISFEVDGLKQYKRQLDFFGIEIGVIDSQKDDIWRIGKLSLGSVVTRSSRDKEQLSTWFTHSKPALRRWDQQIAKVSGVATLDRLFVQFYPADLVARIVTLEAEALQKQGRELSEVDTTNIRISQSGDEFSVSISDFAFR